MEREREKKILSDRDIMYVSVCVREGECMYVRVCVRGRKRERERKICKQSSWYSREQFVPIVLSRHERRPHTRVMLF